MSPLINEEAAAADYLITYLSADTTLMGMVNGVYLRSVPIDAALPVVKIDRQQASDLYTVGLFRVWDDLLFLIRASVENLSRGEEDWTDARAISDRLDTLLHKHEEVTATLQVHSFREESFTDETVEGGKLYLHAGGFYRLRAHAV